MASRAFDDFAEPFVIEAFENIGDQARRTRANAGALPGGGLQEAACRARDIDIPHPPGNDRRNQEILLDEGRQRLADPVLVARDDRRVRDRQAERVAE